MLPHIVCYFDNTHFIARSWTSALLLLLQLFTQLIDTWLVHISLITLCIKYIVVAVLLKVKIEGLRAMPDT